MKPQIEPAGAPVGMHARIGMPNPFAYPPHTATTPVGSPYPIDPEYHRAYRKAKKQYRKQKHTGTTDPQMRTQYKTMRANVRAAKNRGRGLVAQGLVNETTKGGKLVKMSKVKRMI